MGVQALMRSLRGQTACLVMTALAVVWPAPARGAHVGRGAAVLTAANSSGGVRPCTPPGRASSVVRMRAGPGRTSRARTGERGQSTHGPVPSLQAVRVQVPPTIDGRLDEE
ncbi:MAG: hypothetical protein ACT4QD_19220, partial [Acidobacteriota bacterium]